MAGAGPAAADCLIACLYEQLNFFWRVLLAHNKLSRLADSAHPVNVSFEFFPPVSDAAEEQLWQAVRRLETLKPYFVSVTYGAGGSTRERTQRTLKRIVDETCLDVAAHLTCIGCLLYTSDAADDLLCVDLGG